MKSTNHSKCFVQKAAMIALLLLGAVADNSDAATLIQSDTFSFGYGAQVNNTTNTWVLRTSGSTTDGDFTFAPTISGGWYGSRGPLYDGTTLLDTANGTSNYTGNLSSFDISVAASWAGDPDLIAPGVDPNDLKIRLVITSITVYATYYSATADANLPTLAITESTPGHAFTTEYLDVKKTVGAGNGNLDALTKANSYGLLTWDIDNYWVDGTSVTRSFGFILDGVPNGVHIDGYQISGYIEVIPEPSSIGLVTGGMGIFLACARRRSQRR